MALMTRISGRTMSYINKVFKIGYDTKDLMSSFKNFPIGHLILANLVLKACQTPLFTAKLAPIYVKYAMKYPSILAPINTIANATFFKHFCGGSTKAEINQTANRLSSIGIGSILDPAIEEDLPEITAFPNDKILPHLRTSPSSIFNKSVMEDRQLKFLQAIDAAGEASKDQKDISNTSFVAVKFTSMIPTGLLYMLTSSLDFIISKLESNSKIEIKTDLHSSLPSFHSTLASIENEISKLQKEYPNLSARSIVFLQKPENLLKYYLDVYLPLNGVFEITPKSIQDTLSSSLLESINFSKEILEYSAKKSVAIMIDAEQTYFQTAIHYLTFHLIKDSPILKRFHYLYGTYQMYLHQSFSQLRHDSKLFNTFSFPFALKIVRGAYMQLERERAKTLDLPSPINDSIDQTHEQYSKAIDFLLSEIINNSKKTAVFFATHNIESIEKILSWAALQPNMDTFKSEIKMGQLLGMADHLTLSIANSNLASPYKYVPVGTLMEVLPYLLRRAQENSSLFGRASAERQQIKTVILEKSKNFVLDPFFKRETIEASNINDSRS